MEITLEEYKARKINGYYTPEGQEIPGLRQLAERDCWRVVMEHTDDVPVLAAEYVQFGAILGGTLTQASRQKATDFRAVVEKMRARCNDVRAATTFAGVDAVTW